MTDQPDLDGHPLAEALPLMDGTAFEELVADIEQHGQRDPITLYEGMILDGRNRYRACRMLGVECRTEEWEGKGSPVAFVVSKNLRRRDLDASQRAMVVAAFATLEIGNVKAQKSGGCQQPPKLSNAEAAKLANVGVETVKSAKTVRAEGTPEEIAAVVSGAEKVKPVAERIRARRSKAAPAPPDLAPADAGGPATGERIVLPEGETVESLYRKAARIRSDEKLTKAGITKRIGVGTVDFNMMRDIVMIADRDDLSEKDSRTATAALALMNETSTVERPYQMISTIAERLWGTRESGQPRGSIEKARRDKYDRAHSVICAACDALHAVEIPYFNTEQTRELANELDIAAKHIADHRRRLLAAHD